MSYLLDTNVVSELRKPRARADRAVRAWVGAREASDLYLSAVTILELEVGIARLSRRDAAQAARLTLWLEDEVLDVFSGRIMAIGVAEVRRAAWLHVPDPRPERDALIAATAAVHGLTIVTRNVSDFIPMGVPLINPWSYAT